jgi:hypothetical protein
MTTAIDLLTHFTLSFRQAWDAREPWAMHLNDGATIAHREFQQWAAVQADLPDRARQLASDYFLLDDDDRLVFVMDALTHLPKDSTLWTGVFGSAHLAAWELLGEPATKPKSSLILPPGFQQSLEEELKREVAPPQAYEPELPPFKMGAFHLLKAGSAALFSAGPGSDVWAIYHESESCELYYLHIDYDHLPPKATYKVVVSKGSETAEMFGRLPNDLGGLDDSRMVAEHPGRIYQNQSGHMKHLALAIASGKVDPMAPPKRREHSAAPRTLAGSLPRDFERCNNSLRDKSREEIAAAFQHMLGRSPWTVVSVGPLWNLEGIQSVFAYVMNHNNQVARDARYGGPASAFAMRKVILWRDCWSICERPVVEMNWLSAWSPAQRTLKPWEQVQAGQVHVGQRVAHVDYDKPALVIGPRGRNNTDPAPAPLRNIPKVTRNKQRKAQRDARKRNRK